MNLPSSRYRCLVIDPPWPQSTVGRFALPRHSRPDALPYQTMTVQDIREMPVATLADEAAHLWLWTTNRHLEDAFSLMRAWGFTYLTTVTWVKPSGLGAYFASTTQHVLFGYYQRCRFPLARWRPTHFHATPKRHSEKPEAFYDLVRQVSPGPRLDMFARRAIDGFDAWGDEAPSREDAA
jgi:N6-adenosine-specific RNA methylase IME4